jgi:hypothetical protein
MALTKVTYDMIEDGANSVPFTQSGTGAIATTVQDRLRETVSVKDFGAVGDGVADDTAAIQAAIDYLATSGPSSVGGTVFLPSGEYRITSSIVSTKSSPAGQVAIRGAGQFATIFKPDGNFTAIKLQTSYLNSGDFSVEWPVTAMASIPAARIGVEFASGDFQVSYSTIENITVLYAYQGFLLQDWTASTYGTMFLTTLNKLTAFRCADWGFYLNSKVGSTTLRLIQCYARGDNSSGGAPYGKGFYVTNFDDIYTEELAVDQCLNSWVQFVNYSTCVMNSTAFESNKMSSAGAAALLLQGNSTILNGIKDISCEYDTGGNARVIFCGTTVTLALSGYHEQFSTVAGGTTKYKAAFNAATTQVAICDRSITPAQVLNNGWFANAVFEGRRLSTSSIAPNYGTWLLGDSVQNGAPAVGQPKGWLCTVAGSPGTWVSTGNL